MNKSIIALLLIISILPTAIAQNKKAFFLDSIQWVDNKYFIDNENNNFPVLYFENCYNRTTDFLPSYCINKPINSDVEIISYNLTNSVYQQLDKKDYEQIKNLDQITNSEPEIKLWVSKYRKNYYLNFQILPLRKNPISGNIEKLLKYEVVVNYNIINSQKSQLIYASNSNFKDGKWYKIKVATSGIYKLTYSQLVEMGFNNFANIGVFGYGGIVSKIAGSVVADDIPERPIYKCDANGNSIFDEGDYILFYANGPDNIQYNRNGVFSHEINNASRFAYYFVADKGTWKQPINVNSLSNYDYEVSSFDDYVFLEKDSINLINSGSNWFWRSFKYYLNQKFHVEIPNISLEDTITAKIACAARSGQASYFNVNINNVSQQRIEINAVALSSTADYFAKKTSKTYKFKSNSNILNFNLSYTKTTSASEAWLDYISIILKRKIALVDGYIVFRNIKTVEENKNTKFNIANAKPTTVVWDITNNFEALNINGSLQNNNLSFIANSSDLREYIAFDYTYPFPSPIYNSGGSDIGFIENQNLHALQPADIVIVTHPLFYNAALNLKSIHENYDANSVVVVTHQQIYNEFSSGSPDVSAIRNFVKMLYDRATSENTIPQNLVLFGDGSYDNITQDPSVTNFIPTYQSYESLHQSQTYVCDDFFVFLDDGEGGMRYSDNMDMGVGRITAKTATEANEYVNKVRAYYATESYGSYKNNVLIIGDDAEDNQTIHQIGANNIANVIETIAPVLNVEKLFLDDFVQVSTVEGHRYPDVNQAIVDNINNGVQLVLWIGHGNYKTWAHELVLTLSMIKSLKNINKYPIFVTATCDFSPYDLHTIVSGGEELLLHPQGGAIALFTTTRLAYALSNEALTNKFIKQLYSFTSLNKSQSIGMASAKAKNLQGTDSNKIIFCVLGDPAIRAFLPKYKIATTKINGEDAIGFNDTLKARQLVKFEGAIYNPDGNIDENFNGVVYPTVYDKPMNYKTRGNDGMFPLEYKTQKNILFKGKSTVKNGKFEFNFIVPVDIAYFFDKGKVSYYAHNNLNIEANGYDKSFFIGGNLDTLVNDKEGPKISLYMNDEQFVNGGITNENPNLLAHIEDISGINTVGNGIGHDMVMTIDANTAQAIVLNKFFEYEIDNFQKGKVNYPLSKISEGTHTLKVKAWDVINNSNEAELDFIVAKNSELAIEYLLNYPNPFSTNTAFYFNHNQPYIPLKISLQIFTITGKLVKSINAEIISDGFRGGPIIWDGKDDYGDKLAKGVYIYNIKVKAQTGSYAEKFEKLVIIN